MSEIIPCLSARASTIRRSDKPVLLHDVDGVLFATYGPRGVHQIQPGISNWFHWVLARFQLVFLTSWPEAELYSLLKGLYLHEVITASRYLPWHHLGTKWAAADAHRMTHNLPWFWIDDDPSVFPPLIQQKHIFNGLPFIHVNPAGAHALPDVMQRLDHRVKKMLLMLGYDDLG